MLRLSYPTLIAVVFLLSAPATYAQQGNGVGYLPPIISKLLDEAQCPIITTATTLVGDQIVSSQADLKALTGITKIDGSLRILNDTAKTLDFSALDSLIEVESIIIEAEQLVAIDGFNCLSSVGFNLQLRFTASLTTITGFAALTSVGNILIIDSNESLTSISGFAALTTVGRDLVLRGNASLETISGFTALTSVGDDILIMNNAKLKIISGFDVINRSGVAGDITVSGNSLLDCSNPVPNFVPVSRSFGNAVDCLLAS